MRSASSQHGNTPRWAAPEVLEEGIYSKEADIFSFAMVMIEVRHGRSAVYRVLIYCGFISLQVFTGTIPFRDKTTAAAIHDIMSGTRPPQPTHPTFTVELWELMQNCWNQDPQERPETADVLSVLCGA